MSDPDGAISEVGCSHGPGGDGDDDNREIETAGRTRRKKEGGNGFKKSFSRAKKVVLLPFTSKSRKHRKSQRRVRIGNGNTGGLLCGCFCLEQPRTLESPKSNSSDPNDPSFTYDRLKTLIEKNDFFSKECDTHLL